jgi:hypothetical protein
VHTNADDVAWIGHHDPEVGRSSWSHSGEDGIELNTDHIGAERVGGQVWPSQLGELRRVGQQEELHLDILLAFGSLSGVAPWCRYRMVLRTTHPAHSGNVSAF